MFKKDNLEAPPDKVNTVIGKDTFFKGTFNGKGLIRIDGEAEGSISNKGDVVIGESGRLKADLKGRNITIAGYYEGALTAEGKLELKRTATVLGTCKVNNLLIEEGAVIAGSLDMKLKDQVSKGQVRQEANENPVTSELLGKRQE